MMKDDDLSHSTKLPSTRTCGYCRWRSASVFVRRRDIEIDKQAPAVALKEIVIAAAPETVWAVHTDINSWPSWHPDITAAELKGPLEPGSTFTWKSGPGSITSRLDIVESPRRVVWTGQAMGTRAINVWRLEPDGDGTRVVTEESMEGWPVRLLKSFFQKTLDKTLDAWLPALKTRAETAAVTGS